MKKDFPLFMYLPIECMFDADLRSKWSKKTKRLMALITVDMAIRRKV